jgi:SAM-dependent methyltransferase
LPAYKSEIERIKQAYARRDLLDKNKLYTNFNPSALFISQQRERALIKALKRTGIDTLSNKRILDVGCGSGGVLREFVRYGASHDNLYGIDLLPDRIESARKISPDIDLRCGNAEELPYENKLFDIVLLFTVLTSVFDPKMKKNIASEALRVLKPAGIIIYYDYRYNNPWNPDVRGIGKNEIRSLFPDCGLNFSLTTLAPPIIRVIAPYSWLLCYLMEKIPLLRTHYLAIIRKKKVNSA